MTSWREDEASSRALLRRINERIAAIGKQSAIDSRGSFLCECGSRECLQVLEVTGAEYRSVRTYPKRFLVALDHENPEVEFVVSEDGRFSVVELFAEAALGIDPAGVSPAHAG